MTEFDIAWMKLEQLGTCDGIGGVEYERVKHEWDEHDRIGSVEAFIRVRANALPGGGS
jgi:hypothetical protein